MTAESPRGFRPGLKRAAIVLASWVLVLPAAELARAADPLQDTGLVSATPQPDPDLVVVREKFHKAVDLTDYEIGLTEVTNVQSIYFRLFVDNSAELKALIRRVEFDPGIVILGFITKGSDLGGSDDDGQLTETDELFGVGTEPDDYSEDHRGFEGGAQEFVCKTDDHVLVFGLRVSHGVDDFRAIIDYDPMGKLIEDVSFDVTSYDVETLGGTEISDGTIVGAFGSTVAGSGDYGEHGSVFGLPLTSSSEPQVGFRTPLDPRNNLYVSRGTSGDSFVDAYDVDLRIPVPEKYTFESSELGNPVAITDGPDGMLFAIHASFPSMKLRFVRINPFTDETEAYELEDAASGTNLDMTNLPGSGSLFVLRRMGSSEFIDRITVPSAPQPPIYEANVFRNSDWGLTNPAAITDGDDGRLYLVDTGNRVSIVDSRSGLEATVTLPSLGGQHRSATSLQGTNRIYLLRDAGQLAWIDVYDISAGPTLVHFDSWLLDDPDPNASFADAQSITDGPDGLLHVIGRGSVTTKYFAVDPLDGSIEVFHECLEFNGSSLSVTNLGTDQPSTPGEAGLGDEPLLVSAFDPATGDLDIIYGVACESTDNTIEYGPLTHQGVQQPIYSGQVCGIGNSGHYEGFDPGSGSFFFLVVPNDGMVEGSYGKSFIDGVEAERVEDVGVDCPLMQDLSDRCDRSGG